MPDCCKQTFKERMVYTGEKRMSKYFTNARQRWQAQEVLVRFLSLVCVSGTYGLVVISLVQAYILVTWLKTY